MAFTISKPLLIVIMDNVGAMLYFLDVKEGETNYCPNTWFRLG